MSGDTSRLAEERNWRAKPSGLAFERRTKRAVSHYDAADVPRPGSLGAGAHEDHRLLGDVETPEPEELWRLGRGDPRHASELRESGAGVQGRMPPRTSRRDAVGASREPRGDGAAGPTGKGSRAPLARHPATGTVHGDERPLTGNQAEQLRSSAMGVDDAGG